MIKLKTQTQALWGRSQRAFQRLATGGDWAIAQSFETRRNLIWFWLDGFFASASDNITNTYLVVYILALGATQTQIGIMSSLSSLTAAALLLPGAMLVERLGKRRNIVLFGGSWARIVLLFIALLPLIFQQNSPVLIFLVMALAITRDGMNNLSLPAWMSMTNDIVPMKGRGQFFASRNFIMGLAGITVTFLAGLIISRFASPGGYQIALLAAFGIGIFSIYSFAHLSDETLRFPPPIITDTVPSRKSRLSLLAMAREMMAYPEFVRWAAVTALWNLSLNIAGPFFNVYLVDNLHADAAMIGLTSIATSAATMLSQRKLGDLHDRWGSSRMIMVSGLLIPILPLSWIFIDSAWYVIPVNLLGGALWGAYSLASFNYLLQIVPPERMARFSALFQIIVTVSLALGAALGSAIVAWAEIHTVFLLSGIGRFLTALLFVWLIRSHRQPNPITPPAS